MSQYSESPMPSTGEFTAEPSATNVARDQAADVAQHARQAGSQVTQTAVEQTQQVAAEASRQMRDLLAEAQGQVRDQASAQQQKAAQQLHSVADELGQMADKGGQGGTATDLARQAADRLHSAAAWLEKREPADLLSEVRNFARRRPGAFLLGAAVAGLAAGRITRGLASRDSGQQNADGRTVTAVPATDTAAYGGVADTGFPRETGPAGLAEPLYPAESRVYPAEPGAYPAEPGAYPAEPGAYPAEPGAYPAEPGAYPAEPGAGAGPAYRAGTESSSPAPVYPADPFASPEPGWPTDAEEPR
jgi:hypothetical protein